MDKKTFFTIFGKFLQGQKLEIEEQFIMDTELWKFARVQTYNEACNKIKITYVKKNN